MALDNVHLEAAPSPEELVRRARTLQPMLVAARDEADRRRDISPEVVDALRDAGLLNMLKPAEWGGFQADPRTWFDAHNALAEACISTAWIYGVINVQAFWLARFNKEAQADVWGDGKEGLLSSSFRPAGTAEIVPGGYILRGQWPFSSGSSHCNWALVGALTPDDNGEGPPAARLFLVPRSDYEIIDTWNTFGLRATGSNDLRLDGVFVPAYHTWRPDPGVTVMSAAQLPGPALYRMPWNYMFSGAISNLSIGGGRGAIAAFRKSIGKRPQAGDQAPAALARAVAEVEAADALAKAACAAFLRYAEAGEAMPIEEALVLRSQQTGQTRRIHARIDELMLLTGARGINEDGPLTRFWLDLSAMRHHPGNTPDISLNNLGAALLKDL